MRVMMSPTSSGKGGNPYVGHLSRGIADAGVDLRDYRRRDLVANLDVIHVNWPAFLVRWDTRAHALADAAKTLTYVAIARLKGTRVVWTAHDLGGHDRRYPVLQGVYEHVFASLATDVISLSHAAIPMMRRRFPGLRRTRFHVVPHGHYRDDYPRLGLTKSQARERLGLAQDATWILTFGMLRRYKAVERMIVEVGRMPTPVRLLVVGESRDPTYTREIEAVVERTPGAELRVERVDEETAAVLMTAADVVYAAYPPGTSLNSGVAVLALSFDRPVVVRDTPVMAELAELVGSGWVHRAGPAGDGAALQAAISAAPALIGTNPDLSSLDWDRIVASVLDVYRGVPGE